MAGKNGLAGMVRMAMEERQLNDHGEFHIFPCYGEKYQQNKGNASMANNAAIAPYGTQ